MFDKILVPVDLGDPAHYRDAVRAASDFSKLYNSKVRFVSVVAQVSGTVAAYLPEDAHQRMLDEAATMLKTVARESGVPDGSASTSVREGSVYHEVIDEAEDFDADLIIMGSHRPAMSTYLLGSNAARIVRHAGCSVMVLRGSD